ncbi:MAG: hypothetical protein ACI4B5_07425 [Bacteroidaceae bacterium]
MKTEEIDRRIGMPDVDREWARFQQEVIRTSSSDAPRHPRRWGTLFKVAAILIVVLGFSGVIIAEVYQGQMKAGRDVAIDTTAATQPLVEYLGDVSRTYKGKVQTRKGVYRVHLCAGTWISPSEGKEFIEEDASELSRFYYARKGRLTLMLDGKPFDHKALPALTSKDLRKIEERAQGDDLTVNLITKNVQVPLEVTGNLPRAITILLPGKGEINLAFSKAQEGNWMHCCVTSWTLTPWGWSVAKEFERVRRVPDFHAYIYASTEAGQADIDRAQKMLQEVGIENVTVRKGIPIRHFTDGELRAWAREEKAKGTPYGELYNKMAPRGMALKDVRQQWHIVKEVYGVKK